MSVDSVSGCAVNDARYGVLDFAIPMDVGPVSMFEVDLDAFKKKKKKIYIQPMMEHIERAMRMALSIERLSATTSFEDGLATLLGD